MFKRFVLRLPRKIAGEMISQAEREMPDECCGLLAGSPDGNVTHAFALVNALHSPILFESEPRSMFDAMKRMRALGVEMLAVYHSHPLSEPIPSRIDLANNYSDNVQSVIVGKVKDEWAIRSWWQTVWGFEKAELIEDG